MNRRNLPTTLASVVVAFICVWLYVAPYYTFFMVQKAVADRDPFTLASNIDFPAVRESLRGQFGAYATRKMGGESGNSFAALGMALGMAMVNASLDTIVTPEGMLGVLSGQKSGGPPMPPLPSSGINPHYLDFDHFAISYGPEPQTSIIACRHGLFFKVCTIEMPMPGD